MFFDPVVVHFHSVNSPNLSLFSNFSSRCSESTLCAFFILYLIYTAEGSRCTLEGREDSFLKVFYSCLWGLVGCVVEVFHFLADLLPHCSVRCWKWSILTVSLTALGLCCRAWGLSCGERGLPSSCSAWASLVSDHDGLNVHRLSGSSIWAEVAVFTNSRAQARNCGAWA